MMRLLSLFVLCLFVLPATAANLVPNGSFEVDRGWISYGSIPLQGAVTNTPNRIVTTNSAEHGNRVMTLTSESCKSKPIPLLPGNYMLTFSAKGGPTGNERLYWRVVGERGSNLDPLTFVGTTTTTWQRFTNTVSITSVSNYIVVLGEGNGWPVIVDAVMLETGTVASAFSPIPVEFGFSTTNLDNAFMAGETPTVNVDFWNDGAERSATAIWKIYDIFNRTINTITNTTTLAPGSKTSIPVLLPTTNAYLRLHGYLEGIDKSWDENSVTILPYARGPIVSDTNGVLGTHSHRSRYHSSGNRQLGFKWNRGLSVGKAILWSDVQPTSGAMNWTQADVQVHGGSTNGQVLLMNLHGWPTWAVDGAGNPSNNLYINFVTNAVDRYRNYVWNWEILNEPDNAAEMNGWTWFQTYSNLSRLIADTAAAIKAFQPTGYVVALGGVSDGDYGYQVFTNMTVGERANIDAVSTHYYPQDHGFDPNNSDDDYGHTTSVYKWRRTFIEGNVKPVWNTESGIWFGTGFKGDGMFYGSTFYEPNEPSSSYTPEVKRNEAMARVSWRVDMILHAAARSLGWGMKRYFYYDARYPNLDHFSFANPTIYEFNGSLKPNASAILNMQYYLGVGIDRITNQTSANIEAYLFPHPTLGNVIAAWNLDRTNRTLTFTNSQILVRDAFGSGIQTNSLTARVTRNLRYYISGSLTQNQLSNTFKYASVADAADTTAPNVSIDASPIGPVDGSRTLFKWSGDEDTSLPWYQNNHDTNVMFKYRFKPSSTYSSLTQSNHVWATFTPGIYNLDVVAYDAKGNASQATLGPTFSVDISTNWIRYNPLSVTQSVQVASLPLASNMYNRATSKMMKSIDGGASFTEIAWQPGASNTVLISTGMATGTNEFQLWTNSSPSTFANNDYLTWTTNGGSADWLYEITNKYVGVRIINPDPAITSNMFPVVEFQFGNGVWGLTTNRQLQMSGGSIPFTTNFIHATNITVEVIESGPLLAYLRVTQLFKRLAWSDGSTTIPDGTGSNIVEIKMEAFRPIVEIRESTDSYLRHQYDVSAVVTNANQLRFRNGDTMYLATWGGRLGYLWGQATNDAVTYGYDVLKDFETGIDIDWLYSGEATNATTIFYGETTQNGQQGGTGHYTRGSWYVFDNTNGSVAAAPIFGIGNAHMSSARGAGTGALGYYPWRLSASGRYGFDVFMGPRDASGNIRTNKSIHYFLYSGTRTNLTNSASTYYWDMTREFAKMNGVGSLAKQIISELDPTLLSSKTDWGTFTQTRTQVTNLLNRLRTGEANLSNYLTTADSANADMIRAMADSSGYSTLVLVTNIMVNASNFFSAHWERDAMLETPYNFLQGGQLMGREAVRIDAVNMLSTFDTVSAETLFKLRWLGLIYSRAMFDQDIYPMDNILAGLYLGSLGTASMPTEYVNFRSEYSTWLEPLATNGLYTVPQVISTVHGGLSQSLNDYGASITSPHYTLARVVPYMENIMMLAAKGTTNLMLDATLHSKFTNFAEFMFSLQTTVPEPRFSSTNRYRTSMGDGELSRAAIYGQIDTVLRVTDPALASRSKQSWIEQGKPLNAYFQPGFLTVYIDETATANPPYSRHTSGYLSSLRTRIGTGYEGAVWLMNGTFPNDHIGYGYSGAPSFYLLGAPIGPERTPYPIGFNPTVSSPMYRSSAVPTNAVVFTNDLSIMAGGMWAWDSTPTNTLFAAFRYSGVTDARMTKSNDIYVTTVALVSPSPTFDVLLIDDRFTNQLERHYITTSLNVTGNISGTVSATTPTYTYPSSFPGLGSTNWIGPGFAILSWTNASWPNHAAGGAHVQVGAHLKSESNAVYSAYWDTTSAYEPKRDTYLRFEGSNNAARVVVARKPTAGVCTITTNATGFNIVNGSEEMWVATNNWEYALGTQTNAAGVFQDTSQVVFTNGIGISGGQAEVYLTRASTTNISVSASGGAGLRTITNSALPYPLLVATDGQTSRTIGIRRQ